MTSLITILSSEKNTWGQVSNLITKGNWDRVYLICNEHSYDNFDVDRNKVIKLKIDEKNPQKSIKILSNFFKKEIKDFEVAINLVSGNGMEHMAILTATLAAGLGIRMVYYQNNKINNMELLNEKYLSQEYLGDEF